MLQEVVEITVGSSDVEGAGGTGGRTRKCHPFGGSRQVGVCLRRQEVHHEVLGRGR